MSIAPCGEHRYRQIRDWPGGITRWGDRGFTPAGLLREAHNI